MRTGVSEEYKANGETSVRSMLGGTEDTERQSLWPGGRFSTLAIQIVDIKVAAGRNW